MSTKYSYTINSAATDNQELLLQESIFHNANGYIGIRGAFEEEYQPGMVSIRGQYINAFYDIVDMKQAESLHGLIEEKQTILNVVDTQSISIELGNERFSMFEGIIKKYERQIDMSEGLSIRQILWVSPSGYEFTITFRRLASFVRLPLFMQQVTITSHNYSGPVTFISKHIGEVKNFFDASDPRVACESKQYMSVKKIEEQEDNTFIKSKTSRSGLEMCSGVGHQIPGGFMKHIDLGNNEAVHIITGDISVGEELSLLKYSWFTDSVRNSDFVNSCKRGLKEVLAVPVEVIYREQREYLRSYWADGDLEIVGDDELNLAVHYNQYCLLQAVGRDCYSNIAAKGLSGEGYEGHFFWDTEVYAEPYFNIIDPEIAKNLIRFRFQTLDKARENARILGHTKGALYPWRTINGEECSGYFPSGTAAYHINGDVAYSIVAYYLATQDVEFLCDFGAEIIVETARLWIDVGNYVDGKLHIQNVTGPDEYTCLVDNNYFTNAVAKYNLEWAGKCKAILEQSGKWESLCNKIHVSDDEMDQIRLAADCIYLPYDQKLDINPQDDSFLKKKKWDFANTPAEKYPLLMHYHPLALYRKQVCKQADTVLAHFLLEDYQKISTIKNSYDYYENITTHDSSLSSCIFSIMAAKLGMVDKAYEYFGESAKLDLFNTHGNTRDGIHTANMAGNYMSIVYGFAGLRMKESGLYLEPRIPKQWSCYRFRFIYQGTHLEVDITQTRCSIRKLQGNEIRCYLYGEVMSIQSVVDVALEQSGR